MKVAIFAGGLGSRLSSETDIIPKSLVEIGSKPILWHIMKIYSYYGFNDFVLMLGYKGNMIKEYFQNYFLENYDTEFNLVDNSIKYFCKNKEEYKITCVSIEENDQTGGALLRIRDHINNERFMLAYSDTLADININELLKFHYNNSQKLCTMTSVIPEGKYGVVDFDENNIAKSFVEKPKIGKDWINAGFFVCEPEIFNYINDHQKPWESSPLENLAKDKQLKIYQHTGFYKCMDTLKDKKILEQLVKENKANWIKW